jgi:hypothetical protein
MGSSDHNERILAFIILGLPILLLCLAGCRGGGSALKSSSDPLRQVVRIKLDAEGEFISLDEISKNARAHVQDKYPDIDLLKSNSIVLIEDEADHKIKVWYYSGIGKNSVVVYMNGDGSVSSSNAGIASDAVE